MENMQVSLRPIKPKDIGDCLRLSGAEGWNQTESDWKRLVEYPKNTCRIAEYAGKIIGTATACNYENVIAWIGMVLVDKAYRGRGISKLLLTEILAHLDKCRSVKLDATPAGQPVYEKYGFLPEYKILRMTGQVQEGFQPLRYGRPEPVQLNQVADIINLDSQIFGAPRMQLILSILKENPDMAWVLRKEGKVSAFSLGRKGSRYIQIGPVFSSDLSEARLLISHVLSGNPGKPFVADVLADKAELIQWLDSIGFTSQRHFVRMYQYRNPNPGKTENQFLICGPEFG
jgi:GNAT superfamily N-acetyltransferase